MHWCRGGEGLFRFLWREDRRNQLRHRYSTRTDKQKPRCALLKEQFLKRGELVQDRPPDPLPQFAQETLESFDNVQERGLIHLKNSSPDLAKKHEREFSVFPIRQCSPYKQGMSLNIDILSKA